MCEEYDEERMLAFWKAVAEKRRKDPEDEPIVTIVPLGAEPARRVTPIATLR